LWVDQDGKIQFELLSQRGSGLVAATSNRNQFGSLGPNRMQLIAQLHDLFATENATKVPHEHEHNGSIAP